MADHGLIPDTMIMKSHDIWTKMNRREFNGGMLFTMSSVLAQRNPINDSMRVNGSRLNGFLKELSQFGRNPQGGVSRVAYSDADLKARAFAASLMRDAKLEVTVDSCREPDRQTGGFPFRSQAACYWFSHRFRSRSGEL